MGRSSMGISLNQVKGIFLGIVCGACVALLALLLAPVMQAMLVQIGSSFAAFACRPAPATRILFASCVALVSMLPLFGFAMVQGVPKVYRAWRAKYISIAPYLFAAATSYWLVVPLWRWAAVLLVVTILYAFAVIEAMRNGNGQDRRSTLQPCESDVPILTEGDDQLHRGPLLDVIEEHIFTFQTPVLALRGGLGDGKTSVLNLLRLRIQERCVVVYFNAWLSATPEDLINKLFSDITVQCRRYVWVPVARSVVLAFVKNLVGSVRYARIFEGLVPQLTQKDEIQRMIDFLGHFPLRVVVLLDEVDRLSAEEIMAILKVIQLVKEWRNVTFVCAFDPHQLQEELERRFCLSPRYLEKLFPVAPTVPVPPSEQMRREAQKLLRNKLLAAKYLKTDEVKEHFDRTFDLVWESIISKYCVNYRHIKLIAHDVYSSGRQAPGEFAWIDLLVLETLRRFAGPVIEGIRSAKRSLTEEGENSIYSLIEESTDGVESLDKAIDATGYALVVRLAVSWIFPSYAKRRGGNTRRPGHEPPSELDKAVCNEEVFHAYFYGVLPETSFSNAALEDFILRDRTEGIGALKAILSAYVEKASPLRRANFLWKLSRRVGELRHASEIALYIASVAHVLDGDMGSGSVISATNVAIGAVERLEGSAARVLLKNLILNASRDLFAYGLVYHINRRYSGYETSSSKNDPGGFAREMFVSRMRARYGWIAQADELTEDLSGLSWQAFLRWAENSDVDLQIVREFWTRYCGRSRLSLASALDFILPDVAWKDDPTEVVGRFIFIPTVCQLLETTPGAGGLDVRRQKALTRFQELLQGKYRRPSYSS